MSERDLVFVERYERLHEVAGDVIRKLIPDGVEVVFVSILAGNESLDLGLDQVAALLPGTASPRDRDHLVLVHLAAIESHMYRNGYCPTGHLIRILAGNYGVASEEEKQQIVRNGFPCRVGTFGSAEELVALTPLRRVTDTEYSELYERLISVWDNPRQKEAGRMMEARLATVHDLLPHHKIGSDFRRARAGREEPLPMYVRNEIHHPTIDGLLESQEFERDKRIGAAIMEAWLAEDVRPA